MLQYEFIILDQEVSVTQITWAPIDMWHGSFRASEQQGSLCFVASCCTVKRAFLLRQNVTVAAGSTVGCPFYEKTAVCWTLKIDPSGPMTLMLCLMSVIYLVHKSPSKSIFHAVDAAQKMRIGVCVRSDRSWIWSDWARRLPSWQ